MVRRPTEKAKLVVIGGQRGGEEVFAQFNPTEFSREISNNFQSVSLPGLENPILQFVNGESDTVSVELFFDTWTNEPKSNVLTETRKITTLTDIDPALHAPPPVLFVFGLFQFKAVIVSASEKFTMFKDNGEPVRATLSLSLKQYRPLQEQGTRESSDKTKRRILRAGGSLWATAGEEYGDVKEWRRIARATQIENPRLVAPGTALRLPPIDPEAPDGNI